MTDHNLPPERRLDENTKAQMRAELVEASARDEATTKRSWLVPAVAAAAMVGVAALGAGLALGGNDNEPDTREIAPAGSGSADPTASGSVDPTAPEPTGKEATRMKKEAAKKAIDGRDGNAPTTCRQELRQFDLGKATESATMTYAEGKAMLYVAGETWALCDDWAATSDGGAPTLIGGRDTNDPAKRSTYALSENYSMSDDSVAQFVAGGPKLPGVESISYAFPDGHTEDAVIEDDMWLMAYVPTSGPLVQLDSEPTEPVHVTVTMSDGSTATHDLQWGWGTCAQVNHGC